MGMFWVAASVPDSSRSSATRLELFFEIPEKFNQFVFESFSFFLVFLRFAHLDSPFRKLCINCNVHNFSAKINRDQGKNTYFHTVFVAP